MNAALILLRRFDHGSVLSGPMNQKNTASILQGIVTIVEHVFFALFFVVVKYRQTLQTALKGIGQLLEF